MSFQTQHETRGSGRRRGGSRSGGGFSPRFGALLQGGLVLLLCLTLVWAPVPMGSNRPYYLGLLGLLAGGFLIAWGIAAAAGAVRVSHRVWSLWPAFAAFLIAMGFAVFQVIDLRGVDSVLGTNFAQEAGSPFWKLASDSLGQPLPSYVTVNPANAYPAILKTVLYAAVFFLTFSLARHAASARAILLVIALSGAICVAVGFLQLASGLNFGGALADEEGKEMFTRFSSTFANPNHFATYAGIALVAALGLTHDSLTNGIVLNRGGDIAFRTTLNTVFGPALPGIASALVLAGAVVLSASRGGLLAVAIGCAVWAVVLLIASRSKQGGGTSAHSIVLLSIFLLGGAVFSSASFLNKLNVKGLDDNARVEIFERTVDAIYASPVLGNGYGAFINYYPLYARDIAPGTVNAAHNDYLETLSDLGVIGGGALIFAPLYLAFLAGRGAFRRRKGRVFGAVAAGAASLCAVHALFDFSLQIPAVGVLLFATLGVGVAQSWRGEDEDGGDPRMAA